MEDPVSGTEQGRIQHTAPPGATDSHQRATFSDPLPEAIDPTSPSSPEQTLAGQEMPDGSIAQPRDVDSADAQKNFFPTVRTEADDA